MKKILGQSAALAAILALGSPAFADDKIKLELGGYFVGAIAATDGDARDQDFPLPAFLDDRDYKFGSDAEIHIRGAMILDNGLRVGFKSEFELENDSDDVVDEVGIFVEGGWGRFEFGQDDGVADKFSVTSPHALIKHSASDRGPMGFFAPNDDMMDPLALAQVSTVNDSSQDFTKLTYMTPKVGPVKLGFSITPEGENNSQGYTAADNLDSLFEVDEIWEAGIIINETFNDVELEVGATYLTADDCNAGDCVIEKVERNEWNVGVNVGIGGFTVGGSYRDSHGLVHAEGGFSGVQKDYEAWDAGVAWEGGAWKVSAQYAEHEGTAHTGGTDIDGQSYMLSARYKIARGFRIGLGLQHDDDEVADQDGNAVILETALKF